MSASSRTRRSTSSTPCCRRSLASTVDKAAPGGTSAGDVDGILEVVVFAAKRRRQARGGKPASPRPQHPNQPAQLAPDQYRAGVWLQRRGRGEKDVARERV